MRERHTRMNALSSAIRTSTGVWELEWGMRDKPVHSSVNIGSRASELEWRKVLLEESSPCSPCPLCLTISRQSRCPVQP